MTKKFFNDWSNKRSLTTDIYLMNNSYSFEKNGITYRVYNHDLMVNTLDFDGDYISIVATVNWHYTVGRSEKQMRIKIHRKYIKTVYFK
jgi:hypothetical protein